MSNISVGDELSPSQLGDVKHSHDGSMYVWYIHKTGVYPIGSMYAIYGNICHLYTPVLLAYIPYMDPMGIDNVTIFIWHTDPWIRHGIGISSPTW